MILASPRPMARGAVRLGLVPWVALAVLLGVGGPASGGELDRPLVFAVLSDTHVGRKNDVAYLERAIHIIEGYRPRVELIVVAGDLTDGFSASQVERYEAAVAKAGIPVFDVPGNHDVGFRPTRRRMERYYRIMGEDPLPRAVTVKGRHFVGFNSQWLNTRRRPPEPGDPGFDQLDRLEQVLAGLPKGPVFLVHHIPSMPNFVKLRGKPTWHQVFLRQYHRILRTYPVVAVFAGHFHRDELYFVEGRPLLVSPALSTKYRMTPGFRIYTHDRRGLKYRQINLLPRGRTGGYVMDLRGMTEASMREELEAMSPVELRHLILRRYTGTGLGARRLSRLPAATLREILLGNVLELPPEPGDPFEDLEGGDPDVAPDADPSWYR